MANGKIRFGKQSGGELALVIPDGVADTEVTFPESGILTTKQYVDDKYSGFKNKIINGGMDVWQRGTGFPDTQNLSYTADRWRIGCAGNTPELVHKGGVVFSTGAPSLAINGKAGVNGLDIRQFIEELNCRDFTIGTKVTLSFEVYTNSGFVSKTLGVTLSRPIAADSWVSEYDGIGQSFILPSGENTGKKTVTFTIPTVFFTWGTCVTFSLPAGLGTGETIALGNIQLEVGDVATTFEQRPYGLELMLCQRYFYKSNAFRQDFYMSLTNDDSFIPIPFPVTMRVAPSLTFTGVTTTLTGVSYVGTNIDRIIVYASGAVAGGNHYDFGSCQASAEL